jgi:hypothetical protein
MTQFPAYEQLQFHSSSLITSNSKLKYYEMDFFLLNFNEIKFHDYFFLLSDKFMIIVVKSLGTVMEILWKLFYGWFWFFFGAFLQFLKNHYFSRFIRSYVRPT